MRRRDENARCEAPECDRPLHSRTHCKIHYNRLRRTGRLERSKPGRKPRPYAERLWEKVDKSGECWIWTAYCDPQGYGRLTDAENVGRLVHRMVYEMTFGPTDSELDHRCRNRRCVNPSHLRPVTSAQNKHNTGPRKSRSGVRGVHWDKSTGKWNVQVKSAGVAHYGGTFNTIEEAEPVAIALRNSLMTHNDVDRKTVA